MTKQVLVIEDDKINQRLVKDTLEKEGYTVIVVANGEDGLVAFKSYDPDIILIDLYLPGISGIETADRIRQVEEKRAIYTPIVAMTATVSTQIRQDCFKVGIDKLISKPIDIRDLNYLVEQFFKSNTMDMEKALIDLEGDSQLLQELTEEFIGKNYANSLIKDIGNAIDREDYYNLYKQAHKLKGAAACIRANNIYNISCKLESKGKSHTMQGTKELLYSLKEEYKKLKNYVLNYRWYK